jgi:rod shape determining protein RodA
MLAVGLLENIHLRTLASPAARIAPQERLLVRS